MKEDISERLATARAARAKRDAEAAEDAQAMELLALELEERCAKDHGREGPDWRMLKTPEGPIVVKLGPSILMKAYRSSKANDEDTFHFVQQQVVYPEQSVFLAIVGKREGIVTRLENMLVAMHRGQEEVVAGK